MKCYIANLVCNCIWEYFLFLFSCHNTENNINHHPNILFISIHDLQNVFISPDHYVNHTLNWNVRKLDIVGISLGSQCWVVQVLLLTSQITQQSGVKQSFVIPPQQLEVIRIVTQTGIGSHGDLKPLAKYLLPLKLLKCVVPPVLTSPQCEEGRGGVYSGVHLFNSPDVYLRLCCCVSQSVPPLFTFGLYPCSPITFVFPYWV